MLQLTLWSWLDSVYGAWTLPQEGKFSLLSTWTGSWSVLHSVHTQSPLEDTQYDVIVYRSKGFPASIIMYIPVMSPKDFVVVVCGVETQSELTVGSQ